MVTRERHPISPVPDSVARIELPQLPDPTPEEIERRRALFLDVMARRDAIGPIGIRTDDLIHQVRAEADGAE